MNRNSKNILFIIPEMNMGGAQRSVATISNALMESHNVWVVVFNQLQIPGKAFKCDVISLNVISGTGILVKIVAFVKRVLRLRSLKKKLNIDVSISFLEGADYINILSKLKDQVILSIRGSKIHDENMHGNYFFIRKKFIRFMYRRANKIVCVNKGIANEMAEQYLIQDVPLQTIYNFYDIVAIQHLANQELSQEIRQLYQHPTLIMSGRLAPEKGHSFVIKLFNELKKREKNLRLILVGDGPDLNLLINLAESVGLSIVYTEPQLRGKSNPDIYVTGDVENVYKYLKHGTLYILNSSSEGFPNGLAEAMICGLPVIAADCPYGPREILSQSPPCHLNEAEFAEYGILLPMTVGRTDHSILDCWVKTTERLLDSEQYRREYKEKGINRMHEFTKDKILPLWTGVIMN